MAENINNIVKNYDWTTIPKGSPLREKAPRVFIKSYKLTSNAMINRLKNYLNYATTDPLTFYYQMYGDAAAEERTFIFPFFGDTVRNFTNEFGDTFQSGTIGELATKLTGIGDEVTKLIGDVKTAGKPGSYMETPKFYQYGATDGPLEVSFILYNTINDNAYEENYLLVKELIKINRATRIDSIAVEPPRIYYIDVKGYRRIPWAYCSSFDVKFLGTRREIDGIIRPEAYHITMQFTSLTMEVSNFLPD